MKAVENDATELQTHMLGTYHNLRIGIGVIGIGLPVVIGLGGAIADGEPLRQSMSAYYYSPAMRDVFVGVLIAIGACLYLYKGFSSKENRALNLAGVMVVGVALFPTSPPGDKEGSFLTVHSALAVLFFACIAYVAIFRASDTLRLIRDKDRAVRLRNTYRALGIGMLVSPLIAVGVAFALQPSREERSVVFFLEGAAVLMFGIFWLVKSRELRETDASLLALEGKLKASTSREKGKDDQPGILFQIAPTQPEDEALMMDASRQRPVAEGMDAV